MYTFTNSKKSEITLLFIKEFLVVPCESQMALFKSVPLPRIPTLSGKLQS